MTDNGGLVIDWSFGRIEEPEVLEDAIERIPGVISAGLFTRFVKKTTVMVGDGADYRVIAR